MPCLFCNREFDPAAGREKTGEHVFGDWLRPHFEIPGSPGTQVRWNASSTGDQELWSYKTYPADRTVKGVCGECNNGWLSNMETRVKPHLLPALRSRKRRRSFGEGAQSIFSAWAYKTALVVGVKGGRASIPIRHLHDFHEERKPPESTRVWAFATTKRDLLYIDHRTITVALREDGDPPPGSNAFATTLGVGHIGFYVLSWTGPKPDMARFFQAPLNDYLIPIFPSRGPMIWPPRKAFTHEGVDQFANVFGRLPGHPGVV